MPNDNLTSPVDPNVTIPASVLRASAAADAAHRAAYAPSAPAAATAPAAQAGASADFIQFADPTPPQAQTVAGSTYIPTPRPAGQPQPQAPQRQQAPQPQAPQQQPQQQPQHQQVPDSGPGGWEHRYHAMDGRYKQSQTMIGQMQEQMAQLGDELLRTQQMMRAPAQDRNPSLPSASARGVAPRLVTDADVSTYGPELLDTIARAARQAVASDLAALDQRTRQVSGQVQRASALTLHQALSAAVPDWQQINLSQEFKAWCSLPDLYSGRIRSSLLQEAYQAANAPRVIAFFDGFLRENPQATGQIPVPQPQPVLPEPPRQAAVSLELLTAPGRAKPASGDIPGQAAEKPIITRDQITRFYRNVRTGYYSGRPEDKARDEAIIFAAQADGRVR